jgi:hypothetical protein
MHHPLEALHRANAALHERRHLVYALLAANVYVLLGLALPIALTSLEDNIDGLQGYVRLFLALGAAGACAYGAATYVAFRFSGPMARTVHIYLGMAFLLAAFGFAFAHQPDAGILDNFIFSNPAALDPSAATLALDAAILAVALVAALYLLQSRPEWLINGLSILLIAGCAAIGLSLYSLADRIYRKSEQEIQDGTKLFNYSRDHRNIILMFVDGAMSGYLPQILQEEPQLAEQLRGFTWYSNIVSTGNRTINGLPAVFGGFDYTVSEINKRPGQSLKQKVSDAYKIYVDNFSEKGYQVLYSDPFWFGLARKGDCELFNELYEPSGKGRCIHSIGKKIGMKKEQAFGDDRSDYLWGLAKQYAAIAIYRIAPYSIKRSVYDGGNWLDMSYAWKKKQDKYLSNFFSLSSMSELSGLSANKPTFTFITNEVTRAPLFLKEDCLPDHRLTSSSERIKLIIQRHTDANTATIYQTTKCMMRELGRFAQWLHASSVYDNTMLVIASDHGWTSHNPLLKDVPERLVYSMFQSFLMVKQFDAQGPLVESKEFIANANVPGIICDVIGGCVDKTTGKTIAHQRLTGNVLLHETPWQPAGQHKDAFVVEALYSVHSDITKPENWTRVPLTHEDK